MIDNADGVLGDVYLERVDIVHIKPDFTEELIKLDLGQALKGDPDNDIHLQGLDRVRVMACQKWFQKLCFYNRTCGSGRYLLQENMTLYDLIFKAGFCG